MTRTCFVTKIMETGITIEDWEIEEYELDTDERIMDHAANVARDIPSYNWDNDGDYQVTLDD